MALPSWRVVLLYTLPRAWRAQRSRPWRRVKGAGWWWWALRSKRWTGGSCEWGSPKGIARPSVRRCGKTRERVDSAAMRSLSLSSLTIYPRSPYTITLHLSFYLSRPISCTILVQSVFLVVSLPRLFSSLSRQRAFVNVFVCIYELSV